MKADNERDVVLTISQCMKADYPTALMDVAGWESNSSSFNGVVSITLDTLLLEIGGLPGPWLRGWPG